MALMYNMAFVPLVVLAALLQLSAINADCHESWSVNGTMCYKLFTTRLNFENTLQYCLGMGSTLATITSEETDDFVQSLEPIGAIPTSTWIGGLLSADLTTVTWTESEAPLGSEEITSEYRNWASGFPKNRTEETCLSLNQWGLWRNKMCTSKAAGFTCQQQLACDVANCDGCIHENLCAKCSPGYEDFYNNGSCNAMSAACDDGWSLLDTHEVTWSTEDPYYCYKLQAGPANFTSAESGCGEGAILTPIYNQAENDLVKGLIVGGSAVNAWVGERIYHGDTPTDYNNFSGVRGPVVNADNSDSCVAVTGNALGRWHNMNCNNLKPFVCRKQWNY